MFTKTDIIAKAWLLKETVNLVLQEEGLSVERIFLCGSYASGKANSRSDIDFIVQLDKKVYPKDIWMSLQEINAKINDRTVHVIFGTESAAKSLKDKNEGKIKSYDYEEVNLSSVQPQGAA